MAKLSHLRPSKSRRGHKSLLWKLEQLEPRQMLDGAPFPGNFAPPDLNLSAIPAQTATVGQPITLDLVALGATVTDLDANGDPTGDTIRFQLDPDIGTDTPVGATITPAGLFTWTPTAAQVGPFNIIVIAVDGGTPHLADAETIAITVNPVVANQLPVVDLNGPAAGVDFTSTFTEDAGPTSVVAALDMTIVDTDDANLASATVTLAGALASESLDVDEGSTGITSSYDAGTGVLSLTGNATVADYQQVLRTLTYNNTSQDPGVGPRTITVAVSDGTDSSLPATATVTLVPVNDLAAVDLNGDEAGVDFAATFTEDDAALAIAGATATIADPDNATLASAEISITNLGDGVSELLDATTAGTTIVTAYNAATGVLTLTGPASVAEFQQVLRTVTYQNTSQSPTAGVRLVTVTVNDGAANSVAATASITVVPVDDTPAVVITEEDPATSFTEDGGPAAVLGTIAITDADSTTLASATAKIVGLTDGAAESLAVDDLVAGITSSYDPGTGVLTLSGSATLAEYQSVLATLRYNNASQSPSGTSRTVEIVVNDGTNSSAVATATVGVVSVNDAPDLAAIADSSLAVGQDLALAISATDADTGDLLTFLLDPDNSPAGATIEVVDNNNAIIHWTPAAGVAGPTEIRVLVSDNGTPALADSQIFTVTVVAPAAVDLNGAAAGNDFAANFTEDGGPVSIVAADATVTDGDSANLESATITLVDGQDTETLAVAVAGTGITQSYNATTGILTLSGTDTVANYQQVIRTLTYDNSSQNPGVGPRTVNVVVNDGDANSAVASSTVTIIPTNDAAIVDLNAAGEGIDAVVIFTEAGGAVELAPGATVADVDSGNIASLTVAITNRLDGTAESLTFDLGTTTLTGSYDDATGVLLLTGPATVSEIEEVLRTVKYNNTSANPTATPRTITVVANDGSVDSAVATVTVSVVGANAAAVVDLNGAEPGVDVAATFTEDGGAANLAAAATISDVDSTQLSSVTVTLTNPLEGGAEILFADTTGTSIVPSYNSGTGVLTLTGAASVADYQQVLRTLTYNNDSVSPTTTTRVITVVANDGNSDSAVATATVTIVPTNDPPVLAAIGNQQAVLGTELTINVNAADVDFGDTLTFSLDPTGSPASATIEPGAAGTATIRWTPTEADLPGPVQFHVVVTDSGNPALTDDETISVTLSAPAASVDLNGPGDGSDTTVTFTEGDAPVSLADAAATITDANLTTLTGAVITLTNLADAASETLDVSVAGTAITATYDSGTGVLILSGNDSVANYQTVLRTLTYSSSSEDPSAAPRVITVVANNGFANSTAATATVTVVAVNDSPNMSAIDNREVSQYGTLTVNTVTTDPDNTQAELTFLLDLDQSGIPAGAALPTISIPGGVLTWTPTEAGTFEITVLVIDPDGSVDQETFSVTVVADTADPTIAAQLGNDTGTAGDGITSDPAVSGTVTDAGPVTAFVAYLDSADPASAVDVFADLANGQFNFDAARMAVINGGPLADGPHTLHLQATDSDGNTSTVFDLPFTLDTTPPTAETPALLPQSDNGVSNGDGITSNSTITIRVNAQSGEIVRLFQDGVQIDQATAASPVDFVVNSLPDGQYLFHTTVEDAGGDIGTSSDLTVVVDTQADNVTVTSPVADATIDASSLLAGNVAAGLSLLSTLTYRIDSGSEINVTFDGSNNFSQTLDLTGVADGAHVLHVTAIDVAGNQTVIDINVTTGAAGQALTQLAAAVDEALSGDDWDL